MLMASIKWECSASDAGHRPGQFIPIKVEIVDDLAHDPRIERLVRADVGKNRLPVFPMNRHMGVPMRFSAVFPRFEAAAPLGEPFAKGCAFHPCLPCCGHYGDTSPTPKRAIPKWTGRALAAAADVTLRLVAAFEDGREVLPFYEDEIRDALEAVGIGCPLESRSGAPSP